MDLYTIQQRYAALGLGTLPRAALEAAQKRAGARSGLTTERGYRPTPEAALRYAYLWHLPDHTLRGTIMDIRRMDREDGRVKRIHGRTARAASKGGVVLRASSAHTALHRAWERFARRLQLDRREKLVSDLRGMMMEGNVPLQWVIDSSGHVVKSVRMPTETLRPVVGPSGQFEDPRQAYEQFDLHSGAVVATFPLWMLSLVRLDPDNYDDMGCLGRPYLDASRQVWERLVMTEEDMVIRRHDRAPQHLFHAMEGMTTEQLAEYKDGVEQDRAEGLNRDYYANTKGAVTAIQGDEKLDQIADVAYLLDTFFAGAPAPKGLFGYGGDLARDVLQDMKADFFDELDALQDTVAFLYQQGFALELLLQGTNPDNFDFTVQFAERRTETLNQAADRALKLQAMRASTRTVWETAGLNPVAELAQRQAEAKSNDPYPDGDEGQNPAPGQQRPRVSITPGNAPRGESATSIGNRG